MFTRTLVTTIGAALVSGIAGCGSKAPPIKTVPVSGTLTHNGQAVEGAAVTFYPVDPESGKSAGGTTDAAGKYTLKTLVGGTTYATGALVGDYKVTVEKLKLGAVDNDQSPMGIDMTKGGQDPSAMQDKAKEMMEQNRPDDAKSRETQDRNQERKDMAPKSTKELLLPAKYADFQSTDLTANVPSGGRDDLNFDLKD